jgi:hypothetical protein
MAIKTMALQEELKMGFKILVKLAKECRPALRKL